MSSDNARTFYEEFAANLVELINKSEAPWQQNYVSGTVQPFNPVTGTIYQGTNRVKLFMVMSKLGNSQDPRFMTLKHANQCDWRVKKGEKSHRIIHWSLVEEEPDENPPLDEEGNPLRESPKYSAMVRYYNVFHASQLITREGKPIPEYEPALPSYQWESEARAESIILNTDVDVLFKNNYPVLKYATSQIEMPPKNRYKSAPLYYRDIMHELAHWTAFTQFGIAPVSDMKYPQYARNELTAEICAWLTCMELGLAYEPKVNESSVAYIKEWLQKGLDGDTFEIARAVQEAELHKNYLLGFEHKPEKDAQEELDESHEWDLLEMDEASPHAEHIQGFKPENIGFHRPLPRITLAAKNVGFRSLSEDAPGMDM